ncbi:hypothetical protein JTB14_007917 [Gonioctena quinquepunctata]|nr:hypothetical protein JTB14_007917 [Gonioctena quinquepunctata]
MSRKTFDYILQRVFHRLEKKRPSPQQQVKPEEGLIMTIRFLGTGATFRHLAFEFRHGWRTVSNIIYDICSALVKEFGQGFMAVPTAEHLKDVSHQFNDLWGFPNCIGAIDGRHCEIECPRQGGSSYFNYLKYHSIVLWGVADAKKKVPSKIDMGSRGKQSDGRIFTASALYHRLENKEFNLPSKVILPQTTLTVPPVLIGDGAFSLRTHIMRPFPAKNLTPSGERFNDNLFCKRKTIECAFGIQRAKWRFLGAAIELPSMDKASLLIQIACVLHNIIRDRDGTNDYEYIASSFFVTYVFLKSLCSSPHKHVHDCTSEMEICYSALVNCLTLAFSNGCCEPSSLDESLANPLDISTQTKCKAARSDTTFYWKLWAVLGEEQKRHWYLSPLRSIIAMNSEITPKPHPSGN